MTYHGRDRGAEAPRFPSPGFVGGSRPCREFRRRGSTTRVPQRSPPERYGFGSTSPRRVDAASPPLRRPGRPCRRDPTWKLILRWPAPGARSTARSRNLVIGAKAGLVGRPPMPRPRRPPGQRVQDLGPGPPDEATTSGAGHARLQLALPCRRLGRCSWSSVEEPLKQVLPCGTFLGCQCPLCLLPLADRPKTVPELELTLRRGREPGAERESILSSGLLDGGGDFFVQGDGPFRDAHGFTVTPTVLP